MECTFCSNKPCICHRTVSCMSDDIDEIFAKEDLSGVDCKEKGKPYYSSSKGGRYWFDETRGLISLKLLKGLILHAYKVEGKELYIQPMPEDEAKEIYQAHANGYCYMNKLGYPVIKDNKIALMSELCIDELEAIYNLVYQER